MEMLDIVIKYLSLPVTIIIGVWAWYKFNKQHLLNKEIQENKAELEKSIKKYEQCLQEMTEEQKFQNQRRLTDFNLYAAKKHEKYIGLYEKLCEARSKVLWRHNPLRSMPTFADYNDEDMVEFLDRHSLTRARKETLLQNWKSNHREGAQEIYDMMTAQEDFDTRNSVIDAVKAHIQADLYLPRMLSKKIDEYTTKLNELTFLCSQETREGISGEKHQEMYKEREELKTHIENEFSYILESMQSALLND